jgi:hypothetical protein
LQTIFASIWVPSLSKISFGFLLIDPERHSMSAPGRYAQIERLKVNLMDLGIVGCRLAQHPLPLSMNQFADLREVALCDALSPALLGSQELRRWKGCQKDLSKPAFVDHVCRFMRRYPPTLSLLFLQPVIELLMDR